ncbi:hypothetical protein SLS62_002652 [Diatrype stigma]|uniref:Ricin B lectin domain-containing protein n=1 Tax=Diatrype stigma TaxID=117547 RepID=A0AAN9UZZ9_9PEZI
MRHILLLPFFVAIIYAVEIFTLPDSQHDYQIQDAGNTTRCLAFREEVRDPNDYPVRTEDCASAGDSALWSFSPPSDEGYSMFNKKYPNKTRRLSFVAANQFMPLMKEVVPDEKQYWPLDWRLQYNGLEAQHDGVAR